MQLIPLIFIVLILQSYFCQSEIWNYAVQNNTLPSDDTFTIDAVQKKNYTLTHSKYTTDEEDYTPNESIAFSLRTDQSILQAGTVLAGWTYDNINYIFNFENGRMIFIISQENQPGVILTMKNNSELINNNQWHRLEVQRTDRKLKFILNHLEQSTIELTNQWQGKSNIFIGAELIPRPNSDYTGEIHQVIVSNSGRSVKLHEDDNLDEDIEDSSSIISYEYSQTIAFLPHANTPIVYPSPTKTFFKTLAFSFRAHSNLSTLIQFEDISLNIDMYGYLTLGVRNRQTQRIVSNQSLKPINDGHSYFLQMELHQKILDVWIDPTRKTSIELVSSFIMIENFILGLHHQFLGCIENITYNRQVFSFEHIPFNRRQCPMEEIFITQILTFRDNDQPLIIQLNHPEEFELLSFFFITEQSNNILCSLTDQTYEHILIISIRDQRVLVTYYRKEHERIELSLNQSITDRQQHQIILTNHLAFELDGILIRQNLTERFSIHRITMGKLDPLIEKYFPDFHLENFLGCMEDIIFNHNPLIKFEHLDQSLRLTDICQLPHRTSNYISSNISFSIRNENEIVELELPSNEPFNHCQLSLHIRSLNGIILSMYSSITSNNVILFLNEGKLQLTYSVNNQTSSHHFDSNLLINNGDEYSISFSRSSIMPLKYQIPISIPMAFSSFDILILGGTLDRLMDHQFVGCFSNITYNYHPLISQEMVKSNRYDCFYDQDSLCNGPTSCSINQSLPFCGETDCSLVCLPSTEISFNESLVQYSSNIHQGENEEIYITIFTRSSNSTLFMTTNGSIQVSIILQNSYPRLIIQQGGIIYTYDFPGRVRSDQWHVLQGQKTSTTLDLTFDDQRRHYTNLTEDFSLFGNRIIHLCGKDFSGYVQDIILLVDNQHENVIRNSLDKPRLIVYDQSVTWNIRADLPERTPCERIQCLNGGYCIQPTTQTSLAYCHCPSQYSGYRCEQSATIDICVNFQCNQGTCQKDRGTQPYCSCYEGYGGSRCETQIDPCARVNCNYGRCEVDRSRPVCRCYQGYSGSECSAPLDACARASCNYGTCVNEGTSYRCECQRGYEGAACDRSIDPCSDFVCYHEGICRVQETNQPVCQCAPGYRGANCYETDDACHNINCNYGQCLLNQHDGTPYCECLLGYEGVRCGDEIRVIDSFVDPCARYDCYGGTCNNDRGVARCVCPTGRAGNRCQDDICVLYPCANHGQCVPEGGSRRCVCSTPYYGDDCREVYRSNPCDNIYCGYGQCREGICECHGGYSGARCDVAPDLCLSINCNYGTCQEGRCICYETYVGDYCETPTTTPTPPPPPLQIAPTTTYPPLRPLTVGLIGSKKGQLIDYGRLLGARAGPIGWILALVSGLLLLPLALAFAARQCTRGGCLPGAGRGYVPVTVGATGATQTDTGAGNRATRDLELLDQRGEALAASSGGFQTERIEQTREVVREYSGMETAGGGGVFTSYPTMSSRYGDFARDNQQQQQQQQQTSSGYSQQHIIETDYHAPPVADFGYGRGGVAEGYRDTFESWEGAGGGAYSMNTMFADGGLQTDYELSNITSVSMTPNGKYAIVGQSQGPPQIWDAVNGQLVSSMQGTSSNCSKVALACSGTMLVGLASDGIDAQPSILQIWDVNTGKPVQLTHQIKCATFTLSNNSNNLVMAGNQKYGRGISVGILDLNNSELIKEIKSDTNQSYGGTPSFITLTTDERYAIVGCPSGATTNYVVFDLTTQQELVQPPTITLDADPKCSLVLNNEQVLTGTRSGQVILWDIPTCQRIHTLNDNGQSAHRDRITDLKISPDRSFVVTASADGSAKVWDTNSKELISRLLGHKREITCICVSTNQLVATGSKDQNICLWRAPTGQIASTMPVAMTPLDIHMAAHNRTIVAIGEKDGERQLLMLRVVSVQR